MLKSGFKSTEPRAWAPPGDNAELQKVTLGLGEQRCLAQAVLNWKKQASASSVCYKGSLGTVFVRKYRKHSVMNVTQNPQPFLLALVLAADKRPMKYLWFAVNVLLSLKREKTNVLKRKDARDKYFTNLRHKPVVLQGLQSIRIV